MWDETTGVPLNDEEYQNYLELYSHIHRRDLEAEKAFRDAVADSVRKLVEAWDKKSWEIIKNHEDSNNRTQTEQTRERLRVEESTDQVDQRGNNKDS